MQEAPWQEETRVEGMALAYPDRDSVQYVLADEVERRPCLQAALYLRDHRAHPGGPWLEAAECLVTALSPDRFFEYWLLLARHQENPQPTFERLARGLNRRGLRAGLRHLRAGTLAKTLKASPSTFLPGLLESVQLEPRPASAQFHEWGTLLVGCADLKWPADPLWHRVNRLIDELPEGNRSYFCEIYGYLAVRLGALEQARPFLEKVAADSPLHAYAEGGRAPSTGASHLRNYRHATRLERKKEPVLDLLPEHES